MIKKRKAQKERRAGWNFREYNDRMDSGWRGSLYNLAAKLPSTPLAIKHFRCSSKRLVITMITILNQ